MTVETTRYMPQRAGRKEWTMLVLLALAWSVAVGGSLVWNRYQVQQKVLADAQLEADTIINKDLAYRRWATLHGGVYVHPTRQTPPNPWLHLPRRDVVTTSGDRLTLMNPAYMTRQMMTLFGEQYGFRGHITSLTLKNPANAPDNWERDALSRLQQGEKRVSQVTEINHQRYLRLMLPMFMEKGCLTCHADSGVPVGGVRGGISAAVPLERHERIAAGSLKGLLLAHSGIWLVGLTSLSGGSALYRRQKAQLAATEGALSNSQVRFAALTQASPTGVFQTDPSGACIFVNDRWCVMAGITPEQAAGNGWTRVIHPADQQLVQATWQRSVDEQRALHLEFRFQRPDGKTTWVYGQSSAMQDTQGTVIGYVGTITDISEQKKVEQALLAAKEVAEDASRAKSEFLATISHELRTPLNGVMGGAQLLEMTTLDAEQQEYLAMVTMGATQELALVNNLLDLTVIEAGGVKLEKAPFLLRDTLTEAAKRWKASCEVKGLSWSLKVDHEVPEVLIGDARRFMQALDILVHNAIKFTEQGGLTVCVGTHGKTENGQLVRFMVRDTGIGIPAALHEQIFAPFLQADMSHTRRHGGSGLGLSICRRLAIAMGGEIWVESEVGTGSSFYLQLPFELGAPRSTIAPAGTLAEAPLQSAGSSPRCTPGNR